MTLVALAAIIVAALEAAVLVDQRLTSVAIPLGQGIQRAADCTPGDQDPYVYDPARLRVLSPCLHLTGTVRGVSIERDGDRHLQVEPDPPYANLLTPGNATQFGRLVVEPICVGGGDEPGVASECAADPDPIKELPSIGQHVWLEGRYALDSNHYSWAEIHPLYRWGALPPGTGS